MIVLEQDLLVFRFPEVHEHATVAIGFQRTLRIPDDGNTYPLPPGLGAFHVRHLEDYAARVPQDWSERGGVIMPLYQAEAMWISFGSRGSWGYPCAIKIAAGKVNAVSGKPWKVELAASERDYVVVPGQPWLDGFCVAKDVIRQFVAMPLGSGYSVEEQLTGKAEYGGLQIVVYPMRKERYEEIRRQRGEEARALRRRSMPPPSVSAPMAAGAMGLAAGGRMRQQIYADRYGFDAWDQGASSRCFVTLVDAVHWREVTGLAPSSRPPTAADYNKAGLPWFDYYAADVETLAGAPELALVKGVAEIAADKGGPPLDPEGQIAPETVIDLGPGKLAPGMPRRVREAPK